MGSVGNNNINSIKRGNSVFSIVKKIGKRTQYYLKIANANTIKNGAVPSEYHIKNATNPDNAYVSVKHLGTVKFKNDKEMLNLLKNAIK